MKIERANWSVRVADLRRRLRDDSLLRNSLYIMGTTIANAGGGYLFWIVAAHTHPTRDVGLAAALIAAVTLASILTNRGIGGALVQTLATREPGRPWSLALNAGLLAGAGAGLLAGLLALLILPFCSGQFAMLVHDPRYALTFVLGVAIWSSADLIDDAYLAERRAGRVLARNTATTVAKNLFLLLLLPAASLGALGIFGASILGAAGGACAGLLLVRGLGRRYRPVVRGVARQVRDALPHILGHHMIIVGGLAPTYLLPVMVTALLSPADNAYFYTTWMIGSIFFMISPAVSTSLFAEGAAVAGRIGETALAGSRIIAVLLAPIILVFLFGGHLVLTLFGAAYADHGTGLLLALIASAIPDAITNIYVAVLRVERRLGEATLLNVGMAALSLAFAWPLLAAHGIAGAGWAWLLAQTAGSLYVGLRALQRRARSGR